MDVQHKIPGPLPRHPALLAAQKERAQKAQLRLADRITRYAGSMAFVYVHAAVFATWMIAIERRPWPTLTLVVSLEAIFLSTFVMIGQNRQASFQQAKADHDFEQEEMELKTNTELTRQIHDLVTEQYKRTRAASGAEEAEPRTLASRGHGGQGLAPER